MPHHRHRRGDSRSPSRHAGRILAAVAVSCVALLVPAAAGSTPAAVADCAISHLDAAAVDAVAERAERRFHDALDDLRRAGGHAALAWSEPLAAPSRAWSSTMSVQIAPGRSEPGWLHHAVDTGAGDGVEPHEDYVTVASNVLERWWRLGENVGVGGMSEPCTLEGLEASATRTVQALHDAFTRSPGHLANMVGDYNQVGIGVHLDDDQLWVTVRFADAVLPVTVDAAAAGYVHAVHELFLGRRATENELERHTPGVAGGDRLSLTEHLAVSEEWAGSRLDDLYRTVFGRGPDAAGRAYWLDAIAHGLRIEAVAAEFYASGEYYAANGGTAPGFVRGLYRDLLHRSADDAGLAYWTTALRTGTLARSGVTANFYASIESRRDRAAGLWERVVGTDPGSAAVSRWAEEIGALGDIRAAAAMAASDAFVASIG